MVFEGSLGNVLGAWVWDFSPTIFSLLGREVRWYGLLFALGFWLGNIILHYMYRREGRDRASLDQLPVYVILATVIGARLGHVFFYDPSYYLAHPLKILYIWEGGLASHGAAIGIFVAVIGYCIRYRVSCLMLLDRLIVVAALASACIRLGNFANSEIYGHPTSSRYGVVFVTQGVSQYLAQALGTEPEISAPAHTKGRDSLDKEPLELRLRYNGTDSLRLLKFLKPRLQRVFASDYLRAHLRIADKHSNYLQISTEKARNEMEVRVALWGVARHPTQLYEAAFYLLLFLFSFLCWRWKLRRATPDGVLFSLSWMALWIFRYCIEFLKERQEEFEHELSMNMGQMLSLPFICAAGLLLLYIYRRSRTDLIA